jgi:quercetin dioxygenase-like cupin family protein
VSDRFDLSDTVVHVGLGSTLTPFGDWSWDQETLDRYGAATSTDGTEGRMVCMFAQSETWTTWERHPAGDELVLLLDGRIDLIQEIDGEEVRTELRPGQAVINPPGVWHTADVHEPGRGLFITPGAGTEHRPR